MSEKVKVKDSNTGEEVDGFVVKVTKADEPFSYITLEDGTTITIRNNILQVIRLIDRWDDNGNPMYNITGNNSISITSPNGLKRKTEDG